MCRAFDGIINCTRIWTAQRLSRNRSQERQADLAQRGGGKHVGRWGYLCDSGPYGDRIDCEGNSRAAGEHDQ